MKPRSLIFFIVSFISTTVMLPTALLAATGATSTNIELRTFIPKGQTTDTSGPTQTATVAVSGEARCPTGTILIGFNIIDSNAAYKTISGTHAEEKCSGLESDVDNKSARLVVDPTKFTYQIICRPVSLDYY